MTTPNYSPLHITSERGLIGHIQWTNSMKENGVNIFISTLLYNLRMKQLLKKELVKEQEQLLLAKVQYGAYVREGLGPNTPGIILAKTNIVRHQSKVSEIQARLKSQDF